MMACLLLLPGCSHGVLSLHSWFANLTSWGHAQDAVLVVIMQVVLQVSIAVCSGTSLPVHSERELPTVAGSNLACLVACSFVTLLYQSRTAVLLCTAVSPSRTLLMQSTSRWVRTSPSMSWKSQKSRRWALSSARLRCTLRLPRVFSVVIQKEKNVQAREMKSEESMAVTLHVYWINVGLLAGSMVSRKSMHNSCLACRA